MCWTMNIILWDFVLSSLLIIVILFYRVYHHVYSFTHHSSWNKLNEPSRSVIISRIHENLLLWQISIPKSFTDFSHTISADSILNTGSFLKVLAPTAMAWNLLGLALNQSIKPRPWGIKGAQVNFLPSLSPAAKSFTPLQGVYIAR